MFQKRFIFDNNYVKLIIFIFMSVGFKLDTAIRFKTHAVPKVLF